MIALLITVSLLGLMFLSALSWGNTATTPSTPPSKQVVQSVDPLAILGFPTPASTQINVGDALFWNTTGHCLALASNAAWDTNYATTMEDLAPFFVGFSLGQKNVADPGTQNIPVATKGFAVLPCLAVNTIYDLGNFVGLAAQGTHNISDFTGLVVTSSITEAIGYTSQLMAANALQIPFWFQSSIIYGGLQSETP